MPSGFLNIDISAEWDAISEFKGSLIGIGKRMIRLY